MGTTPPGPCGVLAAVQSELLRLLVFGEARHSLSLLLCLPLFPHIHTPNPKNTKTQADEPPPPPPTSDLPSPSPEQLRAALAGAMAAILERAQPTAREVEEAEGGAWC